MKINPGFIVLAGIVAVIGWAFWSQNSELNDAKAGKAAAERAAKAYAVAVQDSAGRIIAGAHAVAAEANSRADGCEKERAQIRAYYQDALLNQKVKTDAVKASLASLSADRIVGEAAKALPDVAADSGRYQGRLSRADSLVALRVLEQSKALQVANEQNAALLALRADDRATIERSTARQQTAVNALYDARSQTQQEITQARGLFRKGRRKALLRVDGKLAEGIEKVGR